MATNPAATPPEPEPEHAGPRPATAEPLRDITQLGSPEPAAHAFIYRPPRGAGVIIGGLITGVAVLLALLLFLEGLDQGATLLGLLALLVGLFLLGLAALFGYWTYGCLTLAYIVDRDGLVIRWGFTRQIIPLREIRRLVVGARIPPPKIAGVNWFGYHVGRAKVERIGDTLFYSVHQRPDEILYVLTAGPAYGLTVLEPAVFAAAVQQQRTAGPSTPIPLRPAHPWPVLQSFLLDRRALIVVLAALIAFTLAAGYLLVRYPGLPEEVAVTYPEAVERTLAKTDLLQFPLTGAAILMSNFLLAYLLHSWERVLSYLLLGAAIGLNLALLIGAVLALA